MRVLVWYPGASVAVHELADGLAWGLAQHGCTVAIYDASRYLPVAAEALRIMGRVVDAKASWIEECHQASLGIYDAALRRDVDWVVMVSGLYQPLGYVVGLQRAGIPVCAVLSESPYNLDRELRVASVVDAVIVMERTAVVPMRGVVDQVAYLPHGWDPRVHHCDRTGDPSDVPACEVVAIGTGWPERHAWYRAVQATGLELSLFGSWENIPATDPLRRAVKGAEVPNAMAAAIYRRATCTLNLHRQSMDYEGGARIYRAESLNPRTYEALACGTWPITDWRAEWDTIWPDLPTVRTPTEMAAMARRVTRDPAQRAEWIERAQERLRPFRWDQRASQVMDWLSAWRPWRRRSRAWRETWHATTGRTVVCT